MTISTAERTCIVLPTSCRGSFGETLRALGLLLDGWHREGPRTWSHPDGGTIRALPDHPQPVDLAGYWLDHVALWPGADPDPGVRGEAAPADGGRQEPGRAVWVGDAGGGTVTALDLALLGFDAPEAKPRTWRLSNGSNVRTSLAAVSLVSAAVGHTYVVGVDHGAGPDTSATVLLEHGPDGFRVLP